MIAHAPSDLAWERLLSRWSLFSGALAAGFLVLMGTGSGAFGTGLPSPFDPVSNFALHAPTLFRLAAFVDATVWFGLAGVLVSLGLVFLGRAPLRASIIVLCGIGQLLGIVGGFARDVLPGVVRSYTSASADRAILLRSYLDAAAFVQVQFNAGAALRTLAYLVVVWIALAMPSFPRWLTGLFALAGFLGLVQVAVLIGSGEVPFVPLVISRLALETVLLLALAVSFWRGRPAGSRA
jgi:hypothetical protein